MEQLIFLLVIGAISLINWLIQKSAEARKKQEQEEARARRGDASAPDEPYVFERRDFDSEAARRLREALGLPDEADVPPPVPRRQQPPPPREIEPVYQEPQPAQQMPPPLPVREPRPMVSAPPAFVRALAKAAPTTVVVDEEGPDHPVLHKAPSAPFAVSGASPAPSRVKKLLASRSGLRDAIVVSEILGPPRSMRDDFR